MSDDENGKRFESPAMPDLDAACNLARSLARNDDAVDHHLETVFAELKFLRGTCTVGGARRRSKTLHLLLGIPAGPLSVFVASPLLGDAVGGLRPGAASYIRKQRSQRLGLREKLE